MAQKQYDFKKLSHTHQRLLKQYPLFISGDFVLGLRITHNLEKVLSMQKLMIARNGAMLVNERCMI